MQAENYQDILGSMDGLRRGFTSGTAAQAAAVGAATGLLQGQSLPMVSVELKDGRLLSLPVQSFVLGDGWAQCSILKDAGDDEDITHGAEFCARVSWQSHEGIQIVGGIGVGVVIKAGLPLPVGEAAINPRPRERITTELTRLLSEHIENQSPSGGLTGHGSSLMKGLRVELSIPKGKELARQTWNPRLGIEGGLSIIGTTGVVEPKSSRAFKASIILALKVLKATGTEEVALAFGYVGERWFASQRDKTPQEIIKFGDHFGWTLEAAIAQGFERIIVAGHVGKMSKVAAGLFDTHWTCGDARLETIGAWAGAAGASPALIQQILGLPTAEAAVSLLENAELTEAWTRMNQRLLERCQLHVEKKGKTLPAMESILLNLEGKELANDAL